jgi:hypothetical protein
VQTHLQRLNTTALLGERRAIAEGGNCIIEIALGFAQRLPGVDCLDAAQRYNM